MRLRQLGAPDAPAAAPVFGSVSPVVFGTGLPVGTRLPVGAGLPVGTALGAPTVVVPLDVVLGVVVVAPVVVVAVPIVVVVAVPVVVGPVVVEAEGAIAVPPVTVTWALVVVPAAALARCARPAPLPSSASTPAIDPRRRRSPLRLGMGGGRIMQREAGAGGPGWASVREKPEN